jgi:hypothetical protein
VNYDDLHGHALIRIFCDDIAEFHSCGPLLTNPTCDPDDLLRQAFGSATKLARGSVARRFE